MQKHALPLAKMRRMNTHIQVDPTAVLRAVDMGPAAEDPGAADFRAFWGDRAELRRFQARQAPPPPFPPPTLPYSCSKANWLGHGLCLLRSWLKTCSQLAC